MRATFAPCSCGPATGRSRKPSRSSVPTAAVRSAPGIWPRNVSRDDERDATETVRPGGRFHAQTMPELRPAAGCLAHRAAHGALRVAYCLVYGACGASRVSRRVLYDRVRRAFAPVAQAPCPRHVVGQTHYGIGTHACLPACLHHPAQPRPHPRPDFRGRIWPRLIPPHRHRDRLGCVVCAPPQRPGTMLRAAWHVAWSRSQRRCDRCTLGRACVTTGCAARVASRCLRVVRPHVELALAAVLLHARRAPGQHREGRQAEPGPVARHGGCARRAAQRATCNVQHATRNMQQTTCS